MPPHPALTPGKTALITGAASGIGFAVAKLCARHGMKLALVDNNAQTLSQAKSYFTKGSGTQKGGSETETETKAEVETYAMDVSVIGDWQQLKGRVEVRFGGVDFLMLNAGIGPKGGWEDPEYFHKIIDTNLFGIVHGISTFLPGLRAAPHPTAIVLTGSKQGITNPPGNAAYNASKAAVKALAEHLCYDLRATPTSVHLLVPGWTFTGMTGGASDTSNGGEKPPGAWTPEQVARFLEARMGEEGGKAFWVICPDNDVTAEMDRRRMLWGVGDAVEERWPLSRWRDEYKREVEEWMAIREG